MEKQNILYFTSYPLYNNDGGAMAILNDIFQLSQIENINFYVAIVCEEKNQLRTGIQLDKLQVKYYFATPLSAPTKPKIFPTKLFFLLQRIKLKIRSFFFHFSPWQGSKTPCDNHNQAKNTSKYLTALCDQLSIRVVIVEQLYSILWFKDFFDFKQKKIYLATDKEAEFYKALAPHYYHKSKFHILISFLRIKNFEKKVCELANKCIFMSEADIPNYLLSNKKVLVNSQVMPPKFVGWHYTNSQTVFFAGNIDYYFNFLAVKWLICELSPRLLRLNNQIKIVITGTNYYDMPKDWTIENNVHIPGFLPQEQLENLFQTSDMFICPIDNDFSVKMKLVECVSYGLPFFATQPCLNALPYLYGLPILDINKPDEAAAYICDTLSKKEALEKLNKQILEDAFNFNKTRKDWWKKAILEI